MGTPDPKESGDDRTIRLPRDKIVAATSETTERAFERFVGRVQARKEPFNVVTETGVVFVFKAVQNSQALRAIQNEATKLARMAKKQTLPTPLRAWAHLPAEFIGVCEFLYQTMEGWYEDSDTDDDGNLRPLGDLLPAWNRSQWYGLADRAPMTLINIQGEVNTMQENEAAAGDMEAMDRRGEG